MDKKLNIALRALYNIRHLAVANAKADEIIRRIIVCSVDACDSIEGRTTSIEDRPMDSKIMIGKGEL